MKRFRPLEDPYSSVRKLLVIAGIFSLAGGCSSSNKQIDQIQIFPSVTSSDQTSIQQCRSVEIRRDGERIIYRSTYFVTDTNGTESLQSEVEGEIPCP